MKNKYNHSTESREKKNSNYTRDSSLVILCNNNSKDHLSKQNEITNTYRTKMITLSKNILLINRSMITKGNATKSKNKNNSDISLKRNKKANWHYFKSKTELKSGILMNAQTELDNMKRSLLNTNNSSIIVDKTLNKKIMSLTKHSIEYHTVENHTMPSNDSKDNNNDKNEKKHIIDISQSITPKRDKLNPKQFSRKLIENIKQYRATQQIKNQLINDECQKHHKIKIKQKIDVFELVRQINPKCSLSKKQNTPLRIVKTLSPEKRNKYPSPVLMQSISKHQKKEKEIKTDSKTKRIKIASSLKQLDDNIRSNLCSPLSPTIIDSKNDGNDSIETFVSSEELIEHIKTCQKIISN